MVVLRQVGVMSVAKIAAVLMAIVGLIQGIVFASLGSMIGSIAGVTSLGMLGGFGVLAIVMFPIMGAISGFIGGAISAVPIQSCCDQNWRNRNGPSRTAGCDHLSSTSNNPNGHKVLSQLWHKDSRQREVLRKLRSQPSVELDSGSRNPTR